MIALLQEADGNRQNRSHAGGCRHTPFSTFESRHTLFKSPDGGVSEARIDVAGLFATETGRRLRGTLENKTGGGKNRLRMFTFRCTHMSGADGESFQFGITEISIEAVAARLFLVCHRMSVIPAGHAAQADGSRDMSVY